MVMTSLIGHRGAAALAPENTLESFAMAHAYGCKTIEFDVVLSADGEAFIFHDQTLDRTSNGRGSIGLVTSDYLRGLDAGSWFSSRFKGTHIPSLQDTIQWLSAHDMSANIEVKPFPGFTKNTVDVVLQEIEWFWPQNKPLPLVSSFDVEALQLCRLKDDKLPLAYLLDRWDPLAIHMAQSLNCISVHLNRHIITPARVAELKELGFLVYVYTVNRQSLIKKYRSWGVDGVFSDYPG